MSGRSPTVAIVGGGFSGAAVAFHLARAGVRADIVVFEPRARLGGGLAYGGDDPIHRVNVPAARMSLLADDPDHFARWLEASGVLLDDPQAFAGGETYPRRREFGRYVAESLRPHLAAGAIRHVRDTVASLQRSGDGWRVRTAGGETSRADLVVIATTHCASTLPPQLAAFRDDARLVADPLVDDVVKDIGADERVLIVGAGLTSADLVAALDAKRHRGPITMISRRGLRARGRALQSPAPEGDFLHPPARTASALLRRVRTAISAAEQAGRTWQTVIEGVRNQGQEIWRELDPEARQRIVKHLRPFWDVHRFRAAPQIEAILDAKLKDGTLALKRARLGAVVREPQSFAVELRDTRARASQTSEFDRILVAIGPTHSDILRSQSFLSELAAAGRLALDATQLGLSASREGRAIAADGRADPTLFIAGPLARGTFGELMGLPQVSAYAQFVAAEVEAALSRAELGEPAAAQAR
jgi:uncharacterized NAD(P)/FAD-binding protein YdhS